MSNAQSKVCILFENHLKVLHARKNLFIEGYTMYKLSGIDPSNYCIHFILVMKTDYCELLEYAYCKADSVGGLNCATYIG